MHAHQDFVGYGQLKEIRQTIGLNGGFKIRIVKPTID